MMKALMSRRVRAFSSGSMWPSGKGLFYGTVRNRGAAWRCLAYFLGLVVLLCASQAWAFPATGTWKGTWGAGGSAPPTFTGSSAAGVCSQLVAYGNSCTNCGDVGAPQNAFLRPLTGAPNAGQTACMIKRKDGSALYTMGLTLQSICPANSVAAGAGNCTCNVGFTYNVLDRACLPQDEFYCLQNMANAAGLGEYSGSRWVDGKVPSMDICDDGYDPPGGSKGCKVRWEMEWSTQVNGHWRTYGRLWPVQVGPYACNSGGEKPKPPPNPDKPEEPDTCKPPQVAGTVNGQPHCYTPSPNKPIEGKPTTSTESETKDNGNGTSTTTTTTTTSQTNCTGGSCNTSTNTVVNTVTTNNTTGDTITNNTTTTNGGTTDPIGEFCKKNPKSSICVGDSGDEGDKSSFGGSCSAGFECKGDAIQCAIARDQHKRHCQVFEPQGTAEEGAYAAAKDKTGNQTTENPNNQEINAEASLGTADLLGAGGAGVQDVTLVVTGQTIVLPLSKLNFWLGMLGNVMVGISFLLAFRIVSRG